MQIKWHILLVFSKAKEKKNWDEEKDKLENSVNLLCSQLSVVCWKSNQTLAFSVRNVLLTQLNK